MKVSFVQLVVSVVWILVLVRHEALGCSWSNEGCHADIECCSKSCHQAHEGTNSRCRHSSLSEKCIFDYHCQTGLTCGSHYNCCSPYWKMCTENSDCCDPAHVCRPADGFIYERCLYPSAVARVTPTTVIGQPLFRVTFLSGGAIPQLLCQMFLESGLILGVAWFEFWR